MLSLQESFWRFSIPEHKLEVQFLLVGKVAEPRVAFDRPGLNFGKVLVGGRTTETVRLINSEHLPFEFQLDRATFDATDAVIESTGEACGLPHKLAHCMALDEPTIDATTVIKSTPQHVWLPCNTGARQGHGAHDWLFAQVLTCTEDGSAAERHAEHCMHWQTVSAARQRP